MKVFMSVVLGVAITLLMLIASWMFSGSGTTTEHENEGFDTGDVALAVVVGALVAVINYCIPMFYGNIGFMAPISLAVMVLMTCYMMYWWSLWGATLREMLPMIALVVIFYFTTKAAAVMTVALVRNYFLISLLLVVPDIVVVLAIGFFVSNMFCYRYERRGRHDLDRILSIIAATVAALVIFFLLCTKVHWNGFSELMTEAVKGPVVEQEADVDVAAEGENTAEVAAQQYQRTIHTKYGDILFRGAVGYYNLMLLADSDPANNFNFAPSPLTEGAMAEDYDFDFRKKAAQDPAFAPAVMGWWDAITGTRFTGRFYETCKGQWADTINMARDEFSTDADVYYEALVAFFRMMDDAKVSIRMGYNLRDQMYMNPYTSSGVPDVIVMTTDHSDGIFLVYSIEIKGNTFEIPYRIDCGYQPTNVQEVMNIIPDDTPRNNPQPNPQPTPQPKPKPNPETETQPETQPQTQPETQPQTQPETQPQSETNPPMPKKDPKESPTVNTQPNDDPGPGPATSNGDGATTSTADQPTNSDHYPSVEDYQKEVEELGTINQEQKTGDDPSIPSTPPTATDSGANVGDNANETPNAQPVTVDNNGDVGNGGAVINTPTPPPSTKLTIEGDPESVGMIGAPD